MEPKIALTEVTKQTVSTAHLNVRISVIVFETEAFVLLAILRVSMAQVKKNCCNFISSLKLMESWRFHQKCKNEISNDSANKKK